MQAFFFRLAALCIQPQLVVATLVALPQATGVRAAELDIVGSSTVYPFTTLVAERFGQVFGGSSPKIESTGTGGGFRLFCAGIGEFPDVSNASRAIEDSEVSLCAANGISQPLEIKIGYDGIVVGQSAANPELTLTRTQLFSALARELPDASGVLRPNQYQTWRSISASLPDTPIRIYGPPPTSGTRDAFVELAMEQGCKDVPYMDKLKQADAERYDLTCQAIREDGAYIEAGENDNLIIQRLVANPDTLGIFGFSFLEANLDKVQGVLVGGSKPDFEAIEQGSYPLARPLFIYVKTEHAVVKDELKDFVEFFVSEASMGTDGFLSERGLVPLPADELGRTQQAVRAAF